MKWQAEEITGDSSKMSNSTSNVREILESLFKQAQEKGSINYIYTLLRLTGITHELDPLLQVSESIKKIDGGIGDSDFVKEYQSIIESQDPLNLIVNLMNCIPGGSYDINPFSSLNKGEFPNILQPDISQRLKFILDRCEKDKHTELGSMLREAFPEKLVDLINNAEKALSEVGYLKDIYTNTKEFLNAVIEIQQEERLKFLKQPTLYKLPRFEVLELLTQPDIGLCGFKMHFSNGTSAEFKRINDATSCINIELRRPINFWVGSLDELKHEWRIGKQRLYEIGLPGRYNKLGEWKPIVYPADSDPLQKEATSFSNDPRIQGSIFYMMCTGHRVVEFVICSTLDLPIEHATLGDKLHLWKCPPLDSEQPLSRNIRIYDGWVELDSVDIEHVRAAIGTIAIAANRLAFTYGASVKWCIKYNMVFSEGGCPSPTESDLEILNESLKKFPIDEDAMILDSAIDWFNHGKNSTNIFTRFLCYYVALELIAINITDGKGNFGLGYSKQTKDKIQEEKKKCIEEKYLKLYKEDPIKFIRDAYFECHESLKSKTRQVIRLIFGESHEYIQKLFTKEEGWSLSDIRGALAHGELSYLDEKHQEIVAKRIYDIEIIARDLIHRLNFRLKPGEAIPSWSGRHSMSCSTADPRMTLVVSDEKIIPNKDWRIRSEWCD